jgi:hypothetical protein
MLRRFTALILACSATLLFAACADEEPVMIRGAGLEPAELPVATQALIYTAALGTAFELQDASLHLQLDTLFLPLVAEEAHGGTVPAELVRALSDQRAIRGVCVSERPEERTRPICADADAPGYLVRFTRILEMPADTVQLYLRVDRYDTPDSRAGDALRFENAYILLNEGGSWRAVREARVPVVD